MSYKVSVFDEVGLIEENIDDTKAHGSNMLFLQEIIPITLNKIFLVIGKNHFCIYWRWNYSSDGF